METKFTPGPWDRVLPLGGVVKGGANHPLKVSDERLEGESWLDMRERTEPLRLAREREAEANIALQKAAPDLYAFIYDLLVNHEIGEKLDSEMVELLAKARGEQP